MKEQPNLEEVITDIQKMIDENQRSYIRYIHVGTLMDILHLLKEKEPKTVLHREDGEYCPRCSTISTRAIGLQKLHQGTSYCPYCGQAVKWDADD